MGQDRSYGARRPRSQAPEKDNEGGISFQTFRTERTQDWQRVDLVFNSMDNSEGNLYLGSWYGKDGKLWWDDLAVEEIGLVNVLRRPGCPVSVCAENGNAYEEGKDYQRIVDPLLHPWIAFHEAHPDQVDTRHAHRRGGTLSRGLLPPDYRL